MRGERDTGCAGRDPFVARSSEEVRALLSRLFGREVDPSLRVFPPFYTGFGKKIRIGKGVFINACSRITAA